MSRFKAGDVIREPNGSIALVIKNSGKGGEDGFRYMWLSSVSLSGYEKEGNWSKATVLFNAAEQFAEIVEQIHESHEKTS